jgi:hypothetical protein
VGYLLIFAPAAALLLVGLFAADHADTNWAGLLAVAVGGTAIWLAYVGLVPHEDGGQTIFGTTPHLNEGAPALWFAPGAATGLAFAAGWWRVARTWAIVAAAAVGPLGGAWTTTPRGDNDGLWGLIFWMIPLLAVFLAGVAAMARGTRLVWDRRSQ